MSSRHSILALALASAGTFALGGAALADTHEGEEMTVHNKTRHEVLAFLLQDDT